MKKLSTLLLALGFVGFSVADTTLYDPAKSIADQHIVVHPWASGTIAETDDAGFGGANSIRFSTKNMFSGGEIVLNGNPDLSKEYGDKSVLLELTFRAAGSVGNAGGTAPAGLRGPGGPPSGPGRGGSGFPPGGPGGTGGRGPGGRGGSGFPGGPGGGGAGAAAAGAASAGASAGAGAGQGKAGGAGFGPGGPGRGGPGGSAGEEKPLKELRLVITTTDGLKSEAYVPADAPADANGWRQVGIPLQVINGFERTNKVIKDISLGGDVTTTIWIGSLQTVSDKTPIRGDANYQDLNLAEGDEVTLSGNGYAGASLLKYSWYFGDDTTGQPDAEGQTVKHTFRKPEETKITLVISDYFGLKQPYKTTINVKVN